jgi:uncharacterized protein
MQCTVRNASRERVLGRVRVAKSLWQRAVGLLGTPMLTPGSGLWLTPCRSVHTFFMRYAIDVIFLDLHGKVLDARTLPPWRFSPRVPRSCGVLEFPAGTLEQSETQIGDRLEMLN